MTIAESASTSGKNNESLIDANVLLRGAQKASVHAEAVRVSIATLTAAQAELCIVPQVIYEVWAVATRPASANGGLGLSIPEAEVIVGKMRGTFTLLPDGPLLLDRWQELVIAHSTRGKSSHDARLVAAMSLHHASHLLTFNGADFQRYPGITIISPLIVKQEPT